MLTIMIHATIKADQLDAFIETSQLLTQETRTKHHGCISYSFNQSLSNPCEFVIYEQWSTQDALDEHIQLLVDLLGPPKPGSPLPEKLLDMYEKAAPVYYRVIE